MAARILDIHIRNPRKHIAALGEHLLAGRIEIREASMDTPASPTSGEIASTIFLYSSHSSFVLNLCPDEINCDALLARLSEQFAKH
jgi:hypothetical protein